MDVIFISYDGMTDPLGQSQVIPYLAGLSKKGYSIAIVSCEKKEKYEKHKNEIQQLLNKNQISWYPVFYSTLPFFLAKQLIFLRLKNKVVSLYKKHKPKLVHARSYFASLVALDVKKKYGLKFIFDMRGFWADERVDANVLNLSNPLHKAIYNYLKKKEIEYLLNADYIISLTENAKNEILQWEQIKGINIPIEVIPCCADLNLFSSNNVNITGKEQLKNKLSITPDDFIISYLGSIGSWYLLDEMLDFFVVLLEKKSNAKFLFITADSADTILIKAKSKGIDENKIIVSPAKRNEVPLYTSLSDISIFFIKPVYSKKGSSPTKMGELLAMGIPIITNSDIGDSDKIVLETKVGAVIKTFTKQSYSAVVENLDVILSTDKKIIREAAENHFSLEKGIEQYNVIYKKLLNE